MIMLTRNEFKNRVYERGISGAGHQWDIQVIGRDCFLIPNDTRLEIKTTLEFRAFCKDICMFEEFNWVD